MRNKILTLSTFLIFTGCMGNQPSSKVQNNINKEQNTKQVKPKEEFEKTISYQDIIMRINDINTKKKTNKRVKKIIKEYQYNVSDDDSKNSARQKALNQVKILILEEIGVFVESYLELNKVVENDKYQKYFKQEIKNLTAGIIKTKILDEKYNGKTYYVKASVLVDPDSVSEGISEILKIKANKSEINKLTQLLKSKEKEIDMRSSETIKLQKKIANQTFVNQAKEEELKQIQIKLAIAEKKLEKYQIEASKINNRLDEIKNIIRSKTNKAIQNIERGMTERESIEVAGKPRNTTNYVYGNLLNYGRVIVHIENGVVACITKSDCEVEYKCVNYKFSASYDISKSPQCVVK